MLNQLGRWVMISSTIKSPILLSNHIYTLLPTTTFTISSATKASYTIKLRGLSTCCSARRRVRSEDEEGDNDNDKESYGYNEDIAMLEIYSQSATGEALIVNAVVDAQEVEVLIFKGFSSCLSHSTAADPSRSVIPARAVITSIHRIKAPFDHSNIEYLERGLTWEAFKGRLAPI